MPSLYVDSTAATAEHQTVDSATTAQQLQQQNVTYVVDDQLAVEFAKFHFDNGRNSMDSRSSTCSDPGYPDPTDIMQLAAAAQRKSQNTTECVPVPSSEHVAEIVGRQGCKIKALRAKTNTYIKTPVRGEEPVFVVTGRKEDVESAKQEILSAAEHFTQIRASRRHSQGGIPAPGHITAYVRVPYKFVGLVVGPKGATIKRIQQQTHTYIITPSRDKEPIFEVTGLSENVETARNEIEMHIVSRTGTFLDDKDAENAALLDDFRTNGVDTAYENNQQLDDGCCDPNLNLYTDESSFVNHHHQSIISKPLLMQKTLTQYAGDSTRNFLSASPQVQFKYNGAWSTNVGVGGASTTMNSSSSDQDEGVWSMGGGESPNSLSIEPLFPSYLSSIWSDLDDPKDVGGVLQKRSASISVPEAGENQGSWFRAVGSHLSARRMSSAPTFGGASVLTKQQTTTTAQNGGNLASASNGGSSKCLVCDKAPVQAAMSPCLHRCFCMQCATRLRQMPPPTCPICQKEISGVIRLL